MTSLVQLTGLPSANSGTPRTLTTVNDGASIALACLSQIAGEGITPTAPGVTFILAQSKNMSGIAMSTRWYVAHGVPAGTVITFTPSATMKWAVDPWEVLGGDGTLGASDSVTNDTTAASSAAAAPGLSVPAGAGVLALFHCDRSPGVITPPTGFTAGAQIVTDENPHYTFAFSRIYSSAASNQRGTLASQAGTMNYSAALLVFPTASPPAGDLSGNVTLDPIAPGGGFVSLPPSTLSGNIDLGSFVAAGGFAAGLGTITNGTPGALKNNLGVLQASFTLPYLDVYRVDTGAFVARFTNIAINSAGIFSITDAALQQGVEYKCDPCNDSTGQRIMPRLTAS